MLVHTVVARLKGTVRVKCLEPEQNTMSWPGIEPSVAWYGDKCTREEAIAPPTTDNVKDSKNIIIVKSSSIPGTMLPCYKLLNIWMRVIIAEHCVFLTPEAWPKYLLCTYNKNSYLCSENYNVWMKKSWKKFKSAIRGVQRNGSGSNQSP